MLRSLRNLTLAAVLAAVAAAAMAMPASGAMEVTKLDRHLCKTVHGGKFVDIPGFPGERIDRRLLRDVRWMKRRYDIFVTDGYATSGHAINGEHPIGLALDIIPRVSKGGNWDKIDRLARKAEPSQNQPRAPWRWVGYNGDPGHGRGNHLHLSYMHSPTPPRDPARVVYTRKCPRKAGDVRDGSGGGGAGGDGSGGDGTGSGGISPKLRAGAQPQIGRLAPIVPEVE